MNTGRSQARIGLPVFPIFKIQNAVSDAGGVLRKNLCG
jgi:hypothetical protein